MRVRSLKVNGIDNVAMVLEDAHKGDFIIDNQERIVLLEDVEFAHKVALHNIGKNEVVIKYGEEIGYALCDIKSGEWIHHHNMGCDRGKKRGY